MRIAIGSDHAGYVLKVVLHKWLLEERHDVLDLGTDSEVPVDYPAFSASVAGLVASGDCQYGIVLGGSGQGEQIAANKTKGIRAALCNDLYTARMARLHNDANILTMGARIVAPHLAIEILAVFLTTAFEGGRHTARIEQIANLES
ncbi:MAG: ribose 5-phosphate isomerase B [Actinomycetota bacterium]